MIDLVVEKKTATLWVAYGDINGAPAVPGRGDSGCEAIGNYFLVNRERLCFQFTTIVDGVVRASTVYGRARTIAELGPNERKHVAELDKLRRTVQGTDRA